MRSFLPALACVGLTSTWRRVTCICKLAVMAGVVWSVAVRVSVVMPFTPGNVSSIPSVLPAGSTANTPLSPAKAALTWPLGV